MSISLSRGWQCFQELWAGGHYGSQSVCSHAPGPQSMLWDFLLVKRVLVGSVNPTVRSCFDCDHLALFDSIVSIGLFRHNDRSALVLIAVTVGKTVFHLLRQKFISVCVHLFSTCPYECIICRFVLYIKCYFDWVVFGNQMLLNRPLVLSSPSETKQISTFPSVSNYSFPFYIHNVHPLLSFPFPLFFFFSPSSPLYLYPFFCLSHALVPWHRALSFPHLSSCRWFHSSLLPIPLCFVLFKVGLWVSLSVGGSDESVILPV